MMIDVLGNALSRIERSDLAFAQFGTCAQCCTRQVPAFGSLRVFETWLPSAEIFEFLARLEHSYCVVALFWRRLQVRKQRPATWKLEFPRVERFP